MNKKTTRKQSTSVKKASDREALVFVESRGKTGIIGALDIMPKTSEVSFVNRVNIGSGQVSVIYTGEVAAARAAQDAARTLVESLGELVTVNVIPRPDERIFSLIQQRSGDDSNYTVKNRAALGIVETDGFTGMIEAADKGIKAADVEISGWLTVGSGLTSVFFRGDVAAVHSAVEAAAVAAERVSKIVSIHVIPQPHTGTEAALPIGKSADYPVRKVSPDEAIGVLETRGITGLIDGIDAGLKAASTVVQGWEKIGRGMASTLFRGPVSDVRSSMDAAVSAASRIGEVIGTHIIARPHTELDKGK
ncbi:MAG: BMC domain-containing protein [Elusimicrobia bacterium]|nr:BMC domain-containing protein [Elusimicrobiota bacterium]